MRPIRCAAAALGCAGNARRRQRRALPFERIRAFASPNSTHAPEHAAGRPVMLDFTPTGASRASWEMERFDVFRSARPATFVRLVLLQADVTANSDDDKELLARFGLFGPPGILFNNKGEELPDARLATSAPKTSSRRWLGGLPPQTLILKVPSNATCRLPPQHLR